MMSVSRLVKLAAIVATTASAQICNLIVPNNPLSNAGLATPYQLTTPNPNPAGNVCDQTNVNTQAFVQGAVINTDTGAISVYNPLVINFNTTAAINPTAPNLTGNRVVALWFGFNGQTLTLQNAAGTNSLALGGCVNGINSATVFGQFSYCNAPQFFASAKNAIAQGKLAVPALGTATKGDGKACPTVRDFMVVDMDQSDNVLTTYLMTNTGKFAQDTVANRAAITNANLTFTVISNPSDNALLTKFIYPAIGCTPWTVADLANANAQVNALPLNEIQAQYLQGIPQALVSLNHVQAKANGNQNLTQVNLYRKGVFQPMAANNIQADPALYCQNFNNLGGTRLLNNKAALQAGTSPTTANANLFDFLQGRFRGAIGPAANGGLGCDAFGITSVV